MPENNPLMDPIAAYRHAIAREESEMTQLSLRNNFYVVFQGVLIAGFLQGASYKAGLAIIVALFGCLISFYHVRAAEAARYWFQWANGFVKFMEGYLVKMAVDNRGDENAPIFPYFTSAHHGSDMANGLSNIADPNLLISPQPKNPSKTLFFKGYPKVQKLFSGEKSSHQYVYAAYMFLVFWIASLIYLLVSR